MLFCMNRYFVLIFNYTLYIINYTLHITHSGPTFRTRGCRRPRSL